MPSEDAPASLEPLNPSPGPCFSSSSAEDIEAAIKKASLDIETRNGRANRLWRNICRIVHYSSQRSPQTCGFYVMKALAIYGSIYIITAMAIFTGVLVISTSCYEPCVEIPVVGLNETLTTTRMIPRRRLRTSTAIAEVVEVPPIGFCNTMRQFARSPFPVDLQGHLEPTAQVAVVVFAALTSLLVGSLSIWAIFSGYAIIPFLLGLNLAVSIPINLLLCRHIIQVIIEIGIDVVTGSASGGALAVCILWLLSTLLPIALSPVIVEVTRVTTMYNPA